MDYIGIKQFDADGQVAGEHRFLGLYTSSAYTSDIRTIPLLRRKVATVIERSGYPEQSHAQRALLNILETAGSGSFKLFIKLFQVFCVINANRRLCVLKEKMGAAKVFHDLEPLGAASKTQLHFFFNAKQLKVST